MRRILQKIIHKGLVTEPLKTEENQIKVLGERLNEVMRRRFQGSLAIRQVDAGSCNGCELEIHAMNNAYYDLERFGVHFVASPRHADLLLVTGPVARNMETALKMTYDAVPNPKRVVAVGDCAVCGGEFGISYASLGQVSNVIPVNVTVAGCPPSPTDIIRGILKAVQ
ncbi:MAG: hydrogenase [Nitrospinae bacterium CG11_big_fil_rev_8_21_14_0_20_45_15]|nr:MAG: hydrogenase [Nitrospinae bacterium CG11_big_fil_rev_8_21_14_0_20_45_15]